MQDKVVLAKEYVRRHFPELADVEPTGSQPAPGITVFTFRKMFETPDGVRLAQTVKITVGADGAVIRTAVSK